MNTARERIKDRNHSARPKVARAIVDPRNPDRHIQVRGTVIVEAENGAGEHIDHLSPWCRGEAKHSGLANQTRVIYTIRPDHVSVMG